MCLIEQLSLCVSVCSALLKLEPLAIIKVFGVFHLVCGCTCFL